MNLYHLFRILYRAEISKDNLVFVVQHLEAEKNVQRAIKLDLMHEIENSNVTTTAN